MSNFDYYSKLMQQTLHKPVKVTKLGARHNRLKLQGLRINSPNIESDKERPTLDDFTK